MFHSLNIGHLVAAHKTEWCHSREGGNLGHILIWIPVFTGMTEEKKAVVWPLLGLVRSYLKKVIQIDENVP